MDIRANMTIGLVGSGGDGVALLGALIQRFGAAAGYSGQMMKYYGAQIRGGGSAIKLNLNPNSTRIPSDTLDFLVCFDWSKYGEFRQELFTTDKTIIICEEYPPSDWQTLGASQKISFTKLSKEITKTARNKNIIALGILTELLGFEAKMVEETIAAEKKFFVVQANSTAFERGQEIGRRSSLAVPSLAIPTDTNKRIIISGNEVVVEAALDAGCMGCFFYPITPASEISEILGQRLVAIGGAYPIRLKSIRFSGSSLLLPGRLACG